MRVLALDPGESVGWATAEVYDSFGPVPVADGVQLHVTDHGIASLRDMALACFRAIVEEKKYDVVVMESWQLSAKHARRLIGDHMLSSQFIGMVRLCCWLSGTRLVMQRPSKKPTAMRSLAGSQRPDAADVLERINKLPASHDESHDGDALMHLWAWFFAEHV